MQVPVPSSPNSSLHNPSAGRRRAVAGLAAGLVLVAAACGGAVSSAHSAATVFPAGGASTPPTSTPVSAPAGTPTSAPPSTPTSTPTTVPAGSATPTTSAPRGTSTVPQGGAPTTAPASSADANTVRKVTVRPADLSPGYVAVLINGGDDASSASITLDICAGPFPSEAYRTARYQVTVGDATTNTAAGLSIETVTYDTEAHAAQALAEARAAVKNCPTGFTPSLDPGSPDTKWVFSPDPTAGWPAVKGVDRLGVAAKTSTADGQTDDLTAFYQQIGRVLVAVYVHDDKGAAAALAASVGGVKGLAGLLATRATESSSV